jgi:hypothetical protein
MVTADFPDQMTLDDRDISKDCSISQKDVAGLVAHAGLTLGLKPSGPPLRESLNCIRICDQSLPLSSVELLFSPEKYSIFHR